MNTKDPLTYAIIGAAMEVHRRLGHGFLEAVYQEALAIELSERGVPFQREAELIVRYKGKPLSCEYRADFLCHEAIVVEPEAVSNIVSAHHAQLINELEATGFHIGLLLNFGAPGLEHRRSFTPTNATLPPIS